MGIQIKKFDYDEEKKFWEDINQYEQRAREQIEDDLQKDEQRAYFATAAKQYVSIIIKTFYESSNAVEKERVRMLDTLNEYFRTINYLSAHAQVIFNRFEQELSEYKNEAFMETFKINLRKVVLNIIALLSNIQKKEAQSNLAELFEDKNFSQALEYLVSLETKSSAQKAAEIICKKNIAFWGLVLLMKFTAEGLDEREKNVAETLHKREEKGEHLDEQDKLLPFRTKLINAAYAYGIFQQILTQTVSETVHQIESNITF